MSDKHSISSWWAENPMTYGVVHGRPIFKSKDGPKEIDFKSRDFFEISDRQLFEWNKPLHNQTGPFGKIFPYQKFRGNDVLEIGCGMGCMAMLWAERGAIITATDLNPVSIEQTRHRFELYGIKGTIKQEDANSLSFKDKSFDYVYSWGVLHHSPEIERSISELFRVLKPEGEFGIMIYNRHSILYRYIIKYLEGFLHGESSFLRPLDLASRYTDGAKQEGNPHTWPMTRKEVHQLFFPYTDTLAVKILGTDLDSIFKMLLPGLGYIIPKSFKKPWARRWGWSLWIYGRKA